MQSPQEFQPTPTTPGRIASSSPNQTRRLVDHKQDIVVTATPQTPTPRVPFSTPLTPPDSSKSRNSLVNTGGAAPDFQNSGQTNQLTTSIDLSQLSSALDSPLAQKSTGSLENTRSPELAALNVKVNAPSPPARTPQSDMSATPTTTEKPAPLEDHRTPNVYINGLPPNFAEEALYAMTKEFGTVISVRTFTRHVSDRPSGYGFVLFDSNDAAECCIESLRKYRNLHPSFSKAVHKIPGTVYAHVPATGSGKNTDPHSFKSKMERLKDESSTNLYMEGLPLSIDESTLEALVTPYKIKSSRFFQTKLSNPPRVIAFVRLETRAACEEIIERLHGRMVRGWNDTGSRISVRFADSNEQRELRRNERVPRETDAPSPAKLTMAQAALLNLHGGAQIRSPSLPQLSPRPGLDPALVLPPSSSLPAHPVVASYQQSSPILPEVDNHMAALLSTLHGPTLGDINAAHPGNSRARYNGYTAVEQQLILQAQRDALELQQQQLIRDQQEALALQAKQQALALEQARLQKQLAASRPLRARAETFSPTDRLPMTEAAFHASARDFTRTENINRSNHSRLASTGTSLPSIESAVHARSTTLPSHHRNRSASISKNAHHRKASATVDTKPGAIIDSHDNATNAASNPQKITNAPSAPTHVMHEDSPLVSPALTFAASSPATSTSTLSPASPMFVPGSVGFGKASVTISDGTHIDGLGLGVGVDNSKVQSVESNIRD